MPVERILEAEKRVECKTEHQVEFEVDQEETTYLWNIYNSDQEML
jgi:hypothetical protein